MTINFLAILVLMNTLTFFGVFFLIYKALFATKSLKDDDLYQKIKDDIKFAFEPMGEVPVGVEEIIELAADVWKIEQRIAKASDTLPEIHQKGLSNSLSRLKNYLNKYDIEIKDYTGQKYNDGLNFDVLSREQDPALEFPVVKETVEPTIICRGRVVKRAKVILASNQI